MGKVFQHYFSTAADSSGTIASSQELDISICAHLERTVCALKCQTNGEAIYVTPLTSDAIVMGKCTCYDSKKPGAFYHNFIISNTDAAKIINRDPFFFSKIVFNDGSNIKDINANSLDELPLSDKDAPMPNKISGIMLQNAYCAFMSIVTNGKMKYMSADETFSPVEIMGIAYTVLPIHIALNTSFVTYSDTIPAIKYNFCFVGQKLFEEISPQNKSSTISLFSSEQALSIASFPRMSRLLERSSIASDEISAYFRFAYDFINIVNKYSGNQLNPIKPELYEPVLCVHTYTNNYATIQKREIPADILAAVDWLDKMIEALPSMENEIRRLVPKAQTAEIEEQNDIITAKRAEREMATKIIGLISANPTDYKSFISIKYQVMREARMETISLSLFQNILRSSLLTMFETEMDDSKITMAAMAVSLAFEVVDYRIYGSECITYAPYDYDAMIEFILMLPLDSRLVYNEVVSLHKKSDMLSIALSNHKKPTRRKKTAKQIRDDDYSDESIYADKKLDSLSESEKPETEQMDIVQDDASQSIASQDKAAQHNDVNSENTNIPAEYDKNALAAEDKSTSHNNASLESSASDANQNPVDTADMDLSDINLDGLNLEDMIKVLEDSGIDMSLIENIDLGSIIGQSGTDSSSSNEKSFWDAPSTEIDNTLRTDQVSSVSENKGLFGHGRKKSKRK